MLSGKPWKIESVLMLGAGLMAALSVGMLSISVFTPALSKDSFGNDKFVRFLISTAMFHGAAFGLVHFFLKQHQMKWRELVGLDSSRRGSMVLAGIGVGVVIVPLILLLNKFSALGLEVLARKLTEWGVLWLPVAPEQQVVVRIVQANEGFGHRLCFALAAIVLAPVVEEVLFRGILYPFIKQQGYPRLALWGTSFVFAAIHFNLMTFVPLTALAILLVLLYEQTDSLLAPILTHCYFNAVNFLLIITESEVTQFLNRLPRWLHFLQ